MRMLDSALSWSAYNRAEGRSRTEYASERCRMRGPRRNVRQVRLPQNESRDMYPVSNLQLARPCEDQTECASARGKEDRGARARQKRNVDRLSGVSSKIVCQGFILLLFLEFFVLFISVFCFLFVFLFFSFFLFFEF